MSLSAWQSLQERISQFPKAPGCYLMKDKKGEIFYIGKAIHLQKRIKNYFTGQDTREFVRWLHEMLADIEVIVVNNEVEALLLERTLIRKHQPRFNILLKDDKNYILLRLNKPQKNSKKSLEYPRLEIVRKVQKGNAKYFGPYPSASQLRTTLHLLNKHFQLRTCSDSVIANRTRPCIQHQIGRCSAPCIQAVPDYEEELNNVAAFLSGQTKELEKRLQHKMWLFSQEENYEAAAKIRDQIRAIQVSLTRQTVENAQKQIDQDVIATHREGNIMEILHLMVRKGQALGSSHFSYENQTFPTTDLLSSFLSQLYEKTLSNNIPNEILLDTDMGAEKKALEENLSFKKGKKVTIRLPKRGKSHSLLLLAQKNAAHFAQEKLQHQQQKTNALVALQKRLDLSFLPNIIECFDISLFQGTDAVASRVTFINGEPDKSRYRKYNIKTVEGTDDYAMLYEALYRRLKRGVEEKDLPQLLLVDGGKGQLNVALRVCKDLQLPLCQDRFFVAGIAKARTLKTEGNDVSHSEERLFIPNVKEPLVLYPHTRERYLIERIRDEAHRFALQAHRTRRRMRTLPPIKK